MNEPEVFEPELTGSHPIVVGAPTARGRVAVELRVVGFQASLWVVALVLVSAWAVALLSPEQFTALNMGPIWVPVAAGFIVHMLSLLVALPRTRWLRGGSLARISSPWPLMLAGILASPFFAWLWWRDRRSSADTRTGSGQIERAFEALTALPRRAALGLAFTLAPSLGIAVVLMVTQVPLPAADAPSWVLLCMSTCLPFAAISYSRTHALLRPELLSAPRDPTAKLRWRRDLRIRLGIPAAVAALGAVLAPLLTAHMWQRAHIRSVDIAAAEQVANELGLGAGPKAEEALGRFLAEHPQASVRHGARIYGVPPPQIPTRSGAVDIDSDGFPEAFVALRGNDFAWIPVRRSTQDGVTFLGLSILAILLMGLTCIWLIAHGVREDVLRAGRQVRRVARGLVPDPLRVDSFNSLELRELVRAVDRLVARIAEANVAKYVVIEKAQEADRLRSQFLANMSHDLRSPLNSVLGFSELLLTGIDGEITPTQREMCEVIQSSGRFLLQQIDDILDTAKIDAGRMELAAEPTPAATLISRAVKKARERIGKDVHIETEAKAGLPPTFTDPYRAVQAIENVLVFASEKVGAGGHLRVVSSAEKGKSGRGRRVLVEVLTPNPPATMEQLDQVLEGFYRIPGHRGLGLALPLAGGVLELHGGSLDIDENEEYMRFLLRFPVPERRKRLRMTERASKRPPGT